MLKAYARSGIPGKVSKMDYLKMVWNAWNLRWVWNAGKSLKKLEYFKLIWNARKIFKNGLVKTVLESQERKLSLECPEKFQKWII